MKTLIAAVLLACSFTSHATETYISLPVASYHIDQRTRPNGKPYNENQLGSGLAFGQRFGDDWQLGYTVGTYKNSYFRRSNYIAAELGYRLNPTVRFGVLVGLISGYGGNKKLVGVYGPLLAPQVEVKLYENLSTTLTFVPTTIRNGSNAIAVQVNWTF